MSNLQTQYRFLSTNSYRKEAIKASPPFTLVLKISQLSKCSLLFIALDQSIKSYLVDCFLVTSVTQYTNMKNFDQPVFQ